MKRTKVVPSLVGLALILCLVIAQVGWKNAEPWRPEQLLEPADLAATIRDAKAAKPLIISIGPAATIKTSIGVGPGSEAENLAKLEKLLSKEPKNRDIVIYCGCCPFAKCPNVRPAFTKLNELGFKNHKLLNVSKNLKTDWIDKDYPVIE
ncbi:rhodanese-like domain-containing protein [Spirosoma sp. KCTC 42546]|uniref:rhodanese-like domain-containing protein n=1 Tax=Spirosoma sp. KCTC 42546 TaxID=2520506 RepID=UPI00115A1534|nr:rhodanese-like domain-containing protein [Spirosoma sp. KCTC 42546]QDK79949.1 rhodanese-like domain-containing protein [Spirosoma sp. KCTC 42546]